jgi:NADP-dependent 3-hydroxy acid dehydrogenase YdfG
LQNVRQEFSTQHKINDGQIVLVSSMLGHTVVKFADMSFYTASKHAIRALTESWRHELAAAGEKEGHQLRIAAVSPGYVKSNFISHMYGRSNPIPNMPGLDTEDVATQIKQIFATPKHVQVHDVILQVTNSSM